MVRNLKVLTYLKKTEVQKLRSSKERKVWKLKRLNVKLGQKRSQFLNSFKLKGYTKPDGTSFDNSKFSTLRECRCYLHRKSVRTNWKEW